ncbi:MAG: phage tail tape measure protein, partial [Pseudomonadota bacterium]
MATLASKLIISLVDRVSGPARSVAATMDRLKERQAANARAMKNTRRQLGGVVAVGAALAAGLAAPTMAAERFESQMGNVATLVDTTTESMSAMGREVLDISRRVPVAIGDLTGSLYDVRSAGIPAADAMGVLENSARLAVAGLGTTKQATDLATSSINAFGLEGKAADAVFDQIFTAIKNGKTTVAGLSQGFGAVAGTVANTGTKIDQYLSSVAALTTTGLPAAQAHTQIRAALSGLTRETKQSQKIFKKLGVKSFKDLVKKSGGMVEAFQDIREVVGDSDADLLKLLG